MENMNEEMRRCIELCLKCHSACLEHAMQHCLEMGGKHVEPAHFRLMLACAEICQSSANMMLIGTEMHRRICAVCAEICEACAKSCDGLDGMEECAAACRSCAESCRKMGA